MAEADKPRWLVVGLGNPGAEYEHTRHNAGFDCIDALGAEVGARYWKSKGGALVAECSWHGLELVLAKPQSFMNCSGGPVKALAAAYGVKPERLIVVHDELDLEPGVIKVKNGGGLAGHNGLKSIAEKLGTQDWLRVRIGVGKAPGRMAGANYVLAVPKGEAKEAHDSGIDRARAAVLCLAEHGLERAQQQFN